MKKLECINCGNEILNRIYLVTIKEIETVFLDDDGSIQSDDNEWLETIEGSRKDLMWQCPECHHHWSAS